MINLCKISVLEIRGEKKAGRLQVHFSFISETRSRPAKEGRGAWTPLNRLDYTRSAVMVTIGSDEKP